MAEEALANAGLYLDEINKIRLFEPEKAQQTNELKDECKEFVDSLWIFADFNILVFLISTH